MPRSSPSRRPIVSMARSTGTPKGAAPPSRSPAFRAAQPAPVRAELDRLSEDIHALIARLRDAPRESDRFLAEMLDRAMRLPDADAIRVRNGRPVLVGWGHEHVGPAPGPVPVLGRLHHTLPPMTILPPPGLPLPASRVWPQLASGAASLVLVAVAGWLLLVPPTVAEPALCRMADGDLDALGAWGEADARNATLRTQLAALVDDAGRLRLRCAPVTQVVSPSRPDDLERARMRGSHHGKLQIILAWDDRNDLDLHVFCPDNEQVFFGNPPGVRR